VRARVALSQIGLGDIPAAPVQLGPARRNRTGGNWLMRLLGRQAAPPPAEEQSLQEEGQQPAPQPVHPAYEDVGHRVTNVLNAAEESAATIRREAQEEAATMRREAQEEAAAASREAARRRQEAEQEAKKTIADAESSARSTRAAAERAAREMEAEMQRRQEELRHEIRSIEESRQRAMLELRDIVADLQNVLLEGPGHAGEPRAGEPETAVEEAPAAARDIDDGPAVRRLDRKSDLEENGKSQALDAERG